MKTNESHNNKKKNDRGGNMIKFKLKMCFYNFI